MPQSFVELLLSGVGNPKEAFDLCVQEWHTVSTSGTNRCVELHDWLGLTRGEYASIVEDPASIATVKQQRERQTRFTNLPTNKPHVSFSEIHDWHDCGWRHKKKSIERVDLSKPSPFPEFGTAIHAACANFLSTRSMDPEIAISMLRDAWVKNDGDEKFTSESLESFAGEALSILDDVPEWFDTTFPGWEFVDAEHQLYEPIERTTHAFKGFIDAVIRCPGKRGKSSTWLLDWKTCGWGWSREKKSDQFTRMQLTLYKKFWSAKTLANPRDVKCGFVLLKRTAKPGKHCELVTTSVGDVTIDRSSKVISDMIATLNRGIAIKNRDSCTFCDYLDTEHCAGTSWCWLR